MKDRSPTTQEVFARLVREGKCKGPTATWEEVKKQLKPVKLDKPYTMEDMLRDLDAISGGN